MNAGKSSSLIQSNFNYQEKGLETMVYIPNCENDNTQNANNTQIEIVSRVGIKLKAININKKFDLYEDVRKKNNSLFYIRNMISCKLNNNIEDGSTTVKDNQATKKTGLSCIFVDEAQFLTKAQVHQLCYIVDKLEIPVLCYGLRSDYLGNSFEGSLALLTLSDKLCEMKSICHCGSKATMNLRKEAEAAKAAEVSEVSEVDVEEFCDVDVEGVEDPNQVLLGHDKYIAVCRKHFYEQRNK